MVKDIELLRRQAERAREEWVMAIAGMDEEGQRHQVYGMLEAAGEVACEGGVLDLKQVLADMLRGFRSRT